MPLPQHFVVSVVLFCVLVTQPWRTPVVQKSGLALVHETVSERDYVASGMTLLSARWKTALKNCVHCPIWAMVGMYCGSGRRSGGMEKSPPELLNRCGMVGGESDGVTMSGRLKEIV